jgi:hypothetical protein
MGVSVWASLPLPAPPPDRTVIWHEQPGCTAALAGLRRGLRSALDDGALPTGADKGERLLLVVEELVSNALRHGRSPVQVSVSAHDMGWLVAVSDTAIDRPPTPALDRDPAHGGMGLSLVARMGRVHGWAVEGDRKIVWARVPYLERLEAGRVREATGRARTLTARLAETASRVARTLDALASQADTAGRTDFARSCRGRAARARLEAERMRWTILTAAPPAAGRPAD